MADDGAASDEEAMTAERFLTELGFDPENEDEVSLFLTWLYPLEPGSEHDMALILSGSEYSELDPERVYILWQYLREAFSVEEMAAISGSGKIVASDLYTTNGTFYLGRDGSLYVIARDIPTYPGELVKYEAKLDLASFVDQRIQKAGVLTQADLTTVESLIRDVMSNQHSAFSQQYSILSVLQDLRASIGLSSLGSGHSVLDELARLRLILTGTNSSVLSSTRGWEYDSKSNGLAVIAGDGTSYGVAELLDMNFKDLDELLLKNFGSTIRMPYYDSFYGTGFSVLPAGSSFSDLLAGLGSTLYAGVVYESMMYLSGSGSIDIAPPFNSLAYFTAEGFMGLHNNLVGNGPVSYSRLIFDGELNKSTEKVDYTDLLHAMVGIGSDLQNPLSQLQAVLAGDSDLELRRNTQENVDSVTDNFTGSGEGAVSSSDISDASGLTSGIGDAFGGNQVSTGDAFKAASDSGNFNFFSQETAVSLDSVSYPAAAVLAEEDDWLSGYVADKDGFYTVADKSGWNLFDYLGKEG